MELSIPSSTSLVCCSSLVLILAYSAVKVSNSIWWKPKKLEKKLKLQGLTGTPYKLLVGDMKEYIRLIKEAWSKPINLNHDIVARVDPFTLQTVQNHGKVSYFWAGTTPRVVVKDPELVKEVLFNKLGHFGKPPLNALILILTKGLSTLEGEDWARHRRVINPAFHFDRLKEMVPIFSISCMEMIESWKRMVGVEGTCEVDVWPELHKLVADIISRALFGSSFKEGKKIFELQNEQMALTLEAMQTLYIPRREGNNRELVGVDHDSLGHAPGLAGQGKRRSSTSLQEQGTPGVDVTLPTLLIHHDSDLWGDDAQEFKPDRFSEGVSKASRAGGTAFLPFSWGPRICIGQNFALIEAKMALAMILQHFSFELSPSYTHAPHTILIHFRGH